MIDLVESEYQLCNIPSFAHESCKSPICSSRGDKKDPAGEIPGKIAIRIKVHALPRRQGFRKLRTEQKLKTTVKKTKECS